MSEAQRSHGGTRPGAGRRPGSKNKRTVALEAKAAQAAATIEAVVADAFQGDAHALLMAIYKDPAQPIELRLEAAGKAIRFEKPLLAAIDMTTTNDHVVYAVSDKPLSAEEWEAKHCGPPKH